jgi:hypothetical protein
LNDFKFRPQAPTPFAPAGFSTEKRPQQGKAGTVLSARSRPGTLLIWLSISPAPLNSALDESRYWPVFNPWCLKFGVA